jgi:hypothetical protein
MNTSGVSPTPGFKNAYRWLTNVSEGHTTIIFMAEYHYAVPQATKTQQEPLPP